MTRTIRGWLLSATLLAALACAAGTPAAWAQNPQERNEPPRGTRADIKEDRPEQQQLKEKTEIDRERLRADIQQFGKNSSQVKADRQQLRQDKKALRRLKRNLHRDPRSGRRYRR